MPQALDLGASQPLLAVLARLQHSGSELKAKQVSPVFLEVRVKGSVLASRTHRIRAHLEPKTSLVKINLIIKQEAFSGNKINKIRTVEDFSATVPGSKTQGQIFREEDSSVKLRVLRAGAFSVKTTVALDSSNSSLRLTLFSAASRQPRIRTRLEEFSEVKLKILEDSLGEEGLEPRPSHRQEVCSAAISKSQPRLEDSSPELVSPALRIKEAASLEISSPSSNRI